MYTLNYLQVLIGLLQTVIMPARVTFRFSLKVDKIFFFFFSNYIKVKYNSKRILNDRFLYIIFLSKLYLFCMKSSRKKQKYFYV